MRRSVTCSIPKGESDVYFFIRRRMCDLYNLAEFNELMLLTDTAGCTN